jgi:hypothetical protein
MDDDTKKPDILEDIKKIDKAVRAKALANLLSTLKEKAKEVLVLKEETNNLLEAIGVSADDTKRVIDFVNSLDDVQLSESEKRKLKDEAKEEVKTIKQRAEKKVNESPMANVSYVNVIPATLTTTTDSNLSWIKTNVGTTGAVGYTTSSSNNLATFSSGNKSVSLKV